MKLYYQVLTSTNGPLFPWKNILRVKASSRVVFFMWSAVL
jgi:hypothetical protein